MRLVAGTSLAEHSNNVSRTEKVLLSANVKEADKGADIDDMVFLWEDAKVLESDTLQQV